ncbi:hypothetical protein [Nostoc linckia]|nr:hypothetical protein [Nostoc linckia]
MILLNLDIATWFSAYYSFEARSLLSNYPRDRTLRNSYVAFSDRL